MEEHPSPEAAMAATESTTSAALCVYVAEALPLE